jgi:mannan endo-1,6-alpha-mannosidase
MPATCKPPSTAFFLKSALTSITLSPLTTMTKGMTTKPFGGFALLSAAEHQASRGTFPSTPTGYPGWIQLAENLFANQISRWNTSSCGGGMKWQIYPENTYGYDYKNAISNGGTFALAARLATLLTDQTRKSHYVSWATNIWNWSTAMGLVNVNASPWEIYDGLGDDRQNCSGPIQTTRWSYNVAVYLSGCAAMYNATMGSQWLNCVYRLLEGTLPFTTWTSSINGSLGGYVLTEAACEPHNTCNTDQFSFKGYTARFMGKILKQWLVQEPAHSQAKAFIQPILNASARAASASCSGGIDSKQCGSKWYTGGWDGSVGAGQEMSALEVIQSLLTLA